MESQSPQSDFVEAMVKRLGEEGGGGREESAGLEKVTMKALERKDYKKKRVKSYLSLCTLCTLRPKTFFRIFNHFLMI